MLDETLPETLEETDLGDLMLSQGAGAAGLGKIAPFMRLLRYE